MITFSIIFVILAISICGTFSNILSQIEAKNQLSDHSLALKFLNNVESSDSTSVCQILLRSSVQNRINNFQSLISTCQGKDFCKIAISNNGIAYGAQNSKYQSRLIKIHYLKNLFQKLYFVIKIIAVSDLIEVDNEDLIRDNSLLGAKYIKFVMSNKYLCINRRLKLFGSVN